MSLRAKTHNYVNLILADREGKAANPNSWAVLLDTRGNLCEGLGSNVFVVKGGTILTPRERYVLPGVSRSMVFELGRQQGLHVEEADLDLFDAYTADEAFFTSTSLCMCPLKSLNGRTFGAGSVPGPITKVLMDAWSAEIDFDFVGQYLRRLGPTPVASTT